MSQQTVDQVQDGDERGMEMKQLGARLPSWMIEDLHKRASEQNIPVRQLVENFIAAGLEMDEAGVTVHREADKHNGNLRHQLDYGHSHNTSRLTVILTDREREIVIEDRISGAGNTIQRREQLISPFTVPTDQEETDENPELVEDAIGLDSVHFNGVPTTA